MGLGYMMECGFFLRRCKSSGVGGIGTYRTSLNYVPSNGKCIVSQILNTFFETEYLVAQVDPQTHYLSLALNS